MQTNWQPTASIEQLRQRATLIASIRQFFSERQVMEVDTPAMSHATVTDIHLHTFQTEFVGPGYADGSKLFFMTSPEFHMKRLLAAGSGCIYQINKAFRNEENGRYHNPEFTMLEWYRVGFDHHQLMDEMDDLLQKVLKCGAAERMTYQQAFIQVLGVCPLEGSLDELKVVAGQLGLSDIAEPENDRDTLLQLLFSVGVENKIGQHVPAFVYDFPASQAALAKINPSDQRVADRFEVYFKGIELANGFHELDNPKEQLARFEQDNLKRLEMGLKPQPIDYHLIAALESGLPDCAGVALGIDRLIMLALGCEHIDQVTAFPFPVA
ncbi:With EpmB is involved in the beta-lysylation step of the post-translational modification of translation elongation factor P (EF-P). Catalyzes the ATP-dependent activation of (R)-beta-lysine produced by EpmB [Vibrio sp. B1FLJ16]|uniref:elongation factor P--(R)-beta-lysine ligase n=1 Tax=Vibrio sp. B1FLJ16 TaxID=2751178 RepID=UPI0015F3A686|nr:elongation factor P--(R)-beta-lysine ligase [Vibrio sp. B1FLJ16]CAD7813014.1 With EpmB is involved in the beta-lysylation step of the post-translational modification of translation elongation factor P (EF-P). Catalyzes the ATP-dependent activation of (R)-beta-lysine produced by EpmB [Vibrio sp. B1FLJ16]CAE6919019.1 With EpmB is involved in the beta-lysylation step of the post-translational modification of translation elongation factor P (EF-P). Catalyzes the ATP-dependent activation of (R)-bet